ncbi:MAG: MG2 domain-containing protein, partial [Acidobacteriota bacterium]
GGTWRDNYDNRHDPCHPGYYKGYYDQDINVYRNVLVSDLGLIAKRGNDGSFFAAATDLKTTQPVSGVEITLLDYQHQVLTQARTSGDGTAVFTSERNPYLLVASDGRHTGYLRLDDGQSLSVSHFDVSGDRVAKGMKGFIYGERGVWRPGDPIHLTFILLNSDKPLPENYPVRLQLRNPRGQLVDTVTRQSSLNGFYTFELGTDPDAPTGNWNVRIKAGGAEFSKILKVETVMPNRLKIALDFGKGVESLKGGQISGNLSASWLHGAPARNLKAAIELNFTPASTSFSKYEEYSFDDPARKYQSETKPVLEGYLDETGNAKFSINVKAENVSPGMLNANFTTRVFEQGGASSIDQMRMPYHPFERYIGIRTPKGDKARGMLLTDTKHPVQIVALDTEGVSVPNSRVKVEIYKIKWRWWWEKGTESIADYLGTREYLPIESNTMDLPEGEGVWEFEIKYPSWGRYLIRVSDLDGKHVTGKIVYVDWPGWAGRDRKDNPGGATVLSFSSDKESYNVGEKVVLTIPAGNKGRGLVSLENGTRIIHSAWVDAGGEEIRYEFTATPEMAPNIYANVTLLQPHMQAGNDLPIRMYGVIPIKVSDPDTQLEPIIESPEVFKPEQEGKISIREKNGKSMTYTLAVVDEGLLDLTRFATPDPWAYFYRREALGVKTWDLFDLVAGAYGGTLERLLAIGGGADAGPANPQKANRFPPLVRFLGPFELNKGKTNTHQVSIPQYVGSVRIMVTAGQGRAFGHADRAVFVRNPLMILGTLPRVLGPEEEVDLPVAVFALEDKVKDVAVDIDIAGPVDVVGPKQKSISFDGPGEDLVTFRLKTQPRTGVIRVALNASGDGEKAGQKIEMEIRMPAYRETLVMDKTLEPGDSWNQAVEFTGMEGTNKAWLEISRIPPIDLARRLDFLIRYPHGCVEQITSSVFPQLYSNRLLELDSKRQDEIQANINAGIDRLRLFQTADGGFSYWPGNEDAHSWASSYAGHFLVEAEKSGYLIPPGVLEQWKKFQRNRALSWTNSNYRSELIQAYRLYTLALAGSPELGAMNRLKEAPRMPDDARWRLAAAFQMAGQPEAAEQLVLGASTDIPEYRELSDTFGSSLRDKAMVLETLGIMNMMEKAFPLAQEVSLLLSSEKWLSTQTTAYALIAMARMSAVQEGEVFYSYAWPDTGETSIRSELPVVQNPLTVEGLKGGTLTLENNGDITFYARIIRQGVPRPGTEKASQENMALDVKYYTLDNKPLDPTELEQGLDFIAEVTVTNTGYQGEYKEVALTHMVPSGWEIRNLRMVPTARFENSEFEYQDIRDDRVYTYFDIPQGRNKVFYLLLNSSYLGRFYLPSISAEAMYDATINARVPGYWITVKKPGTDR